MPVIAVLLVLAAVVLFWSSRRWRKEMGLPAGRVISSDMRGWDKVEEPLYDAQLGLTGRPDYLVQQGSGPAARYIPVEVKSARVNPDTAQAPYDSHIFQLAAYCLLVERVFGKRPPYGILHYSNRTFAVDYTPELENALLDLLQEMRVDEHRRGIERSHQNPGRCSRCGYRSTCDQSLAA
jgi:CRISPR-associated exonuclease Cas4